MARKGITLTKNDESVLFTFTDSDHYLVGNGTIEVPLNSLSLVIDSSDMVTFRKAASNDIFVSAPISDFGMSKAELEEWYAENMVGGTGGSVDPEQLAGLIADAEYISSATTIAFYNLDGDEVCHIDATDFIKDGMVSNVEVVGTNLVITFNTDAGKNPISIPLTSFFDGSQYYDKTAIDTMLHNAYADTDTALNALSGATDAKLANKADASGLTQHISDSNVHFTGSQKSNYDAFEGQFYVDDSWDVTPLAVFNEFLQSDFQTSMGLFDQRITSNTNAIATKADTSAVTASINALSGATDTALSGKANVSDLEDTELTLAQAINVVDGKVASKADISAVTAIADSLSGKQDTLIAGSGITISGNVISAEGGSGVNIVQTTGTSTTDVMSQSAVTNAFNEYTVRKDSENGIVRYWTWKSPNYPYGQNGISNFAINGKCPLSKENGVNSDIWQFSLVETSAITTSMTSGSTDSQVPSAKAVYDTLGAKQDALVSGTNIKTINNESILGSGNISVSADLTNYYTKTEIDGMIGDIETLLASI